MGQRLMAVSYFTTTKDTKVHEVMTPQFPSCSFVPLVVKLGRQPTTNGENALC